MSLDAVEKCEAWLKSLGPVIFSIPIRFKSYSDVWIPFIWGCTNIIMGMLNYRKKCALKCLRKDAIKIFDDLRQLNNFENLDDISCTKTNLVNRDERLHTENFKINLERVVENLSGNVKKEQEQKLIYNIFQDYLTNHKNALKNNHMERLDLIKIVNHIRYGNIGYGASSSGNQKIFA